MISTILITPVAAGAEDDTNGFSIWKFSTGVLSAYAVHEAAHYAAAIATDTDMEWECGTYNQPIGFTEHAHGDSEGLAVHASGLVAQVIGSEVILQWDRIDKNDDFVRGMMAWNIINPIIYALDYYIIRRANQENGDCYQGDIKGVEHYSDDTSANAFAISMAAIASWQGYRFIKTQDWAPEWMRNPSHQFMISPVDEGGFHLSYNLSF